MERETQREVEIAKLAKERLFGDEGSNHLRKQLSKARFLESLPLPPTAGDETNEQREGATEPAVDGLSIEPVRIGRFTVLRKLGQGGMGVVYAAYDEQLDRRVALKLLHGDLSKDARGRARMQREAQALARLSHPNVVQVHEIGQWRDHEYVAMEFVDGQTLLRWVDSVEGKQRSWREILDVMIQAGRGLAAAHAAGLVHRDFKPANLLVGEDGRPRVLDFGLARAATDADADAGADDVGADEDLPDANVRVSELLETGGHTLDRGSGASSSAQTTGSRTGSSSRVTGSSSAFDQLLTDTGAVLGTPAYMAPEQHVGERATELSDQFSFCLVLYEALFGERPYKVRTRHEYAAQVLGGDFTVPSPSSGVPGWLRQAVCRGLAPQPANRWASMDALLAELGRDRARMWKRAGVAAGLFASIGVAVALGRAEPAVVEVCEYDRSVVADSWGEPQRASMSAAFAATKLDGAASVFDQTARALDHYADDLVAARQGACEQRWVAQMQTDQQLELRVGCLEQREAELGAVVGLLAAADQGVVLHASELVQGLGDINMCARVELLERNTPVPKDEVTAAAIAGVRRDIATAEASARAGRIEAANELMISIEERAVDLGYGPLLAEVAYLEGGVHISNQEFTVARDSFMEAARLAELSNHDELSARTWIRIAQLSEYADPSSSTEFMLATVGLSLLGDRPSDRFALHLARGRAFGAQGQFVEAIAEYDEAVTLAEAGFLGSQHQRVAALIGRSALAASLGRDQQARDDLVSAVDMRAQLGADHYHIIGATHDLAIVELEQLDYAAAELHFREVIAGYERIYGPRFANMGHANLGLARVAVMRGQFAKAEQLVAQALTILDAGHEDHAWALDAMAGVQLEREMFSAAVDTLERALAHTQTVAPANTQELGYRHSRLGLGLADLGEHERALQELDRAIELLSTDSPTIDQVKPLIDRGGVLLGLGQPALALASFERALELIPLDSDRPELGAEARLGLAEGARDLGDHARQLQLAAEAERLVCDIPEAQKLCARAKELQGT